RGPATLPRSTRPDRTRGSRPSVASVAFPHRSGLPWYSYAFPCVGGRAVTSPAGLRGASHSGSFDKGGSAALVLGGCIRRVMSLLRRAHVVPGLVGARERAVAGLWRGHAHPADLAVHAKHGDEVSSALRLVAGGALAVQSDGLPHAVGQRLLELDQRHLEAHRGGREQRQLPLCIIRGQMSPLPCRLPFRHLWARECRRFVVRASATVIVRSP